MKEGQPSYRKFTIDDTNSIYRDETVGRDSYDFEPPKTSKAIDKKVRQMHRQGRVVRGWHPEQTTRTYKDPVTKEQITEDVTPLRVHARLYSRRASEYTILYPTVEDLPELAHQGPVNMAIEVDPSCDRSFSPHIQSKEMNRKVSDSLQNGRAEIGKHLEVTEIVHFGKTINDIRLVPVTPLWVTAEINGTTNEYTIYQPTKNGKGGESYGKSYRK